MSTTPSITMSHVEADDVRVRTTAPEHHAGLGEVSVSVGSHVDMYLTADAAHRLAERLTAALDDLRSGAVTTKAVAA